METITLREKTEQELDFEIEKYFQDYPTAGYGTWISKAKWWDEVEKKWCVIIQRELSCD